MKIRYLDGRRLYYAFLAGGRAVIRDQHVLDRINVFPVPDADTGTNLATTMRAIAARARSFRSAELTLGSLADAAITGARGNSGIIFAQFVYGFSREARNESRLTPKRFAELARRAAQYARQSIMAPVEGTMITLLHDWAEAVYEQRLKMTDFAELLSYSLRVAEKSLRETPEKLDVLAKAGVVDAGAKGFFDFLEGIVQFIRKGEIKGLIEAETAPLPAPAEGFKPRARVTRRYCSEALLTGPDIDLEAVRAAVQAAGESAVIAGSHAKVRLHVHTDSPADLFAAAAELGTVTEIKTEDMLRQYQAAHQRKAPVAVVTDSACDLPRELLDDHQIHLIPFTLSVGESVFLDKLTITPDRFYTLQKKACEAPKSAQPSQAAVGSLLEFLAGHYDRVLAVTVSGNLTGLHGQALVAAEKLGQDKVQVVDSRHVSGSQGLIVLRAAEAVRAGLPAEEIAVSARGWAARTRLWVDVRTLKYLVRGGRVSPLKGFLAGLLNIKPIITLNEEGRSAFLGKSFSRRGNMRKILGLIRRETAGRKVWNFAVVHAHNPYRALRYAERMTEFLGRKPAFIMDVSPVIGVHCGPGAVGVCLMFD